MLKWTVQERRRLDSIGDNLDSLSILSESSGSGSSISDGVPASRSNRRPLSLALDTNFDISQEQHLSVPPPTAMGRRGSTPGGRSKRHSMIAISPSLPLSRPVTPRTPGTGIQPNTHSDILKISTTAEESVLRISTKDDSEKSKRSSFWKNLKAKAAGKKDKRLAKAQSMTNLPGESSPTTPNTSVCIDPAEDRSPRSKSGIQRRRSFKMIKKQNENKKPKPFSKTISYDSQSSYDPIEFNNISPDSGIGCTRTGRSDSDGDNPSDPASPVTPIDVESEDIDLSALGKQFTDAVLEYLNSRLDGHQEGDDSSDQLSANSTSHGDIFCYDSDTVVRRGHSTIQTSAH